MPAITDIADDIQLVRFAARAQTVLVTKRRRIAEADVARAMGVAPTSLNAHLRGNASLTNDFLRQLDSALIALHPDLLHAGGLLALSARLHGHEGPAIGRVSARVPPFWTDELMKDQDVGPIGVLLQASALLSAFLGANNETARSNVLARHRQEVRRLVHRLILIGVSPPTSYSVEALILLGSLACHAFDEEMQRSLTRALQQTPLGFRVWRAATSIVHAYSGAQNHRPVDANSGVVPVGKLKAWIKKQLGEAQALRARSLYPARSLDLELAIAVPADWSPIERDWAGDLLRARVGMNGPGGATVRERATAALGLWERAWNRGSAEARRSAEEHLLRVAEDLRSEAEELGAVAPTGLRWVADTIDHVVTVGQKVCNSWPTTSREACKTLVEDQGRALDVPDAIRDDAGFLFEQALLQNAGVYRRRAIDTLRASGWAEQVAAGLGRVLPKVEPWLRCRTLFALGFLQERGDDVQEILTDAYHRAFDGVQTGGDVTRDRISEMHAALFAIGDCVGVPDAGDAADDMRRALDHTLLDLADRCVDEPLRPIPRAVAYLVTVTARPDDRVVLERLSRHPDPLTQEASRWGLHVRFDDDGKVRPIDAAPM